VAFGVAKRNNLAAKAAITARAEYLQPAMAAVDGLYKRQATSAPASAPNYDAAMSSACACGFIDPGTTPVLCTATGTVVMHNHTFSQNLQLT